MSASVDDRPVAGEAVGVVAAPDRVSAWMAVAQPGDEFVYATRLRLRLLPAKSPGAAAMRSLAEAGLVQLFQRLAGDSEGQWRNYVARRTSRPMLLDDDGDATVSRSDAVAEDAVLEVLTRRAALARPCPSLRELAQLTELPNEACDAAMRALAEKNVIHIGTVPAPTRRVVTILATGQATGAAR
ncbi:hypothetical protein ACFSGX_14025 [Sphingomonas arantia]|uniref:Uncharacterized protein n=1 Tax=Sphingomonas arantia TaxID=1460676 RepID=A0ABW4TYY7_9SPHN